MPDYDTFEEDSQPAIMSGSARSYGSAPANLLAQILLGHHYTPTPGNRQDMQQAEFARSRQANFLRLAGGHSNGMLMRRMGIGNSPAARAIGMLTSNPNGAAANLMSGLSGGNLVAASMKAYGGMSGAGVMGAFGRTDSVTFGETMGLMNAMTDGITDSSGKKTGGMYIKEAYNTHKTKANASLRATAAAMSPEARLAAGITDDYMADDADYGPDGAVGQKVRAKQARRLAVATDLDGLDTTIKDITTKSNSTAPKDKAALEKHKKAAEEEVSKAKSKFFERLEMTDAEKRILASEVGSKGAGAVANGLRKTTKLERGVEELNDTSDRYRGIDFAKTRGFKLEDIVGGFRSAASLRMLGDSKKVGLEGSMAGFTDNAGGAYSAARSILGKDKSMGELTKFMSDTMGATDVDLKSAAGSKAVEDLLRKTKATASVAGMSIKALLGIIDAGKQLAANNPQLQHLNSATLHESMLGSVQRASTLNSSISNLDSRTQGGEQGMVAADAQSNQNFLQSSLGGAQLSTFAIINGVADPQKRGELIAKYKRKLAAGEMSSVAMTNPQYIKDLAAETGMAENEAVRMLHDQNVQRAAMQNREISKTVGGQENIDRGMSQAFDQRMAVFGKNVTVASLQREYSSLSSEQRDSMGGSTAWVARKVSAAGLTGAQAQAFTAALTPILQRGAMTPAQRAAVDKRVAEYSKESADLDEKYAHAYSPLLTQVAHAALSGEGIVDSGRILAGMLATKRTDENGAIIDSTQKAGEGLLAIASDLAGVPEAERLDRAIAAGAVDKLNEWNRTAGTKRGDISAEDFKLLADPKFTSSEHTNTAAKAKKRLAQLRKDGQGSSTEAKALAVRDQLGMLDSPEAFALGAKGLAGALAAPLAATEEANKVRHQEELTALEDKKLHGDLLGRGDGDASVEGSGAWLLAQYTKDGKTDYATLRSERAAYKAGDKKGGFAQLAGKLKDDKARARLINVGESTDKSQRDLERKQNELAEKDKKSPAETEKEAIKKMIGDAIGALAPLNGVVAALTTLANAIQPGAVTPTKSGP